MKTKEFTKEEIANLIETAKSGEVNLDEIFREKLDCYIVYGDTDENRVFLDYVDSPREPTGIAIKVNTPAGDYYLVRALRYSLDSNFGVAVELAAESKVAGGDAVLPGVDELLELYDQRDAVNTVAKMIGADVLKEGWTWTKRAIDKGSAVEVGMDNGYVKFRNRNDDYMYVLLFSAFKC